VKTPDELATILREAQSKANAAAPGDDGGTCNLDDVVLQPGRHIGRMKKAFAVLGWRVDGFKWLGATTYFCGFHYAGQAAQRERMANAAYNHLKEALTNDDIWVGHWQQMD
jgi:hypothetical protein